MNWIKRDALNRAWRTFSQALIAVVVVPGTIAAGEVLRTLVRSGDEDSLTGGVFGITQFASDYYELNAFDSGLDFVELLELGGGMPTRVNVPTKRLDAALATIREALRRADR